MRITKGLGCLALVIAIAPWLAERIWTFNQRSLPYHCESQFGYQYLEPNGAGSIASRGSMQLAYYSGGNGVGTYIGRLYYLDAQGKIEKELSVHRALEFSYEFKPGLVKTTTLNASQIQGDEVSDAQAIDFVYPGFRVGQKTYGVIVKIANGDFAVGSSHFPRAVCAPLG